MTAKRTNTDSLGVDVRRRRERAHVATVGKTLDLSAGDFLVAWSEGRR